MRLGQFRENPENPSKATEEQLERLAGKLKRVPLGLTAMRIAYVTDDPGGGKMVISGNKRLRVLKKAYGEDGEVPDEWFQDVTDMSPAERHEFIVTANVSDGDWDLEKLSEQYDKSELKELMDASTVDQLLEDFGEGEGSKRLASPGGLAKKYIVPPFSVLRVQSGGWMERKRAWKELINDNGESREEVLGDNELMTSINGGTSILDPVLAEVMLKWYCPDGGSTFDCFAGDSIFGYVAAKTGHDFTGIELRQEQADLNNSRTEGMTTRYYCDDGQNVLDHVEENSKDFFFSCPPYYDLEVYSDLENDASNQPTYEDFLKILENAFTRSMKCLKNNRFAVIVVGDVRDDKGFYYDFPGDIKRIFRKAGLHLYNELILADALGTAMMRANVQMRNRKTVKVHQNVIVFYKGDVPCPIHQNILVFYKGSDPKNIQKDFAPLEFEYEGLESTALEVEGDV